MSKSDNTLILWVIKFRSLSVINEISVLIRLIWEFEEDSTGTFHVSFLFLQLTDLGSEEAEVEEEAEAEEEVEVEEEAEEEAKAGEEVEEEAEAEVEVESLGGIKGKWSTAILLSEIKVIWKLQ